MAIVASKGENEETYFRYYPPNPKIIHSKYLHWLNLFHDFLKHYEIDDKEVNVSLPLFSELIVRIDKRKDYFKIYHEGTNINEIKEIALVAYWIIKFKPFHIDFSPDEEPKIRRINESFAMFLIFGTVRSIHEVYQREFVASKYFTRRFKYALDYWDISKEAMMLICEALCPFCEETDHV